MTLSDIRAILTKNEQEGIAGPQPGEAFEDFSQRMWDAIPRIPYAELPAALQKSIREIYPASAYRKFLVECYAAPEFEKYVHSMTEEEKASLPEPPASYISFQTLTEGIDESILEGLLIRARNTAIYALEYRRTLINTATDEIYPVLYGNYACAAFEDVLAQYRATVLPSDGQQQAEQILSILQSAAPPKEITAPKDAVTRGFFNNQFPVGKTGKVRSGDEITVTDEQGHKVKTIIAPIVTVSLQDLPPGVQITRELNATDNAVFNAVCSLYANGNKQFTGQMIYSVMVGNPAAKATADWLEIIDECWTRLTATQIELDTGTVGDAYNFKRWKRQRTILQGGRDTITVGNQYGQTTTIVYSLAEKPILHDYAEALKQINRYPRILQNTPVNKTPDILNLQNYLIDHINAIPNISNHIRYDTIWQKFPIQTTNPARERKIKSKLRGYIHKMLDYWKETGFISGWSEEKKGAVVYAIVIAKPRKPAALPEPPEKVGTPPGKNGDIPPEKVGTPPGKSGDTFSVPSLEQ